MRIANNRTRTNLLIRLTILTFALPPSVNFATECELVPQDKKNWSDERVIQQKYQVDAIFIGTVIKIDNLDSNICSAHVKPDEIIKGNPGNELIISQTNNRYDGANENKCGTNWIKKNKRYLMYASKTAMVLNLEKWFFPFCSLDAYLPYELAHKEIDILRKLSKTTSENFVKSGAESKKQYNRFFACADTLPRADGQKQKSTMCKLASEYCYEASGGAPVSHGAKCKPLPSTKATCKDLIKYPGTSCTGTPKTGFFVHFSFP